MINLLIEYKNIKSIKVLPGTLLLNNEYISMMVIIIKINELISCIGING